jgi:integrase/recombinase XerD
MGFYALTPDKYLTEPEEQYLRGMLEKHRNDDLRNTTMLLLMLVLGLRAREALNVVKADLNFDDRCIFVDTIKRGRPRVLPLTDDLIGRLKELSAKTEGERLFPIGSVMLYNIWDQYRPCKKGSHALRHTAAKNIYQKTKDISVAQALLGHASISTTSVYLQIQISADKLRDAIV